MTLALIIAIAVLSLGIAFELGGIYTVRQINKVLDVLEERRR